MQVMLKAVRIAFPDLFVAKQFEGAGPFAYSATFLVDPTSANHKVVQDAILSVATEAWKDKAKTIIESIKGNSQKCCYYSGDLKDYDGFAGNYALSAKRKEKDGHPKVIDGKMNELAAADGKPYGGCYVHAKVDIWAQDNEYGKGIRCTLIAVQFHKDGEAFSATGPATIEGFSEEADETDGLL